jgi:large subunit ribosomal protein L4
MAKTTILNATGGDAGSVDLAESLFGAPVNESLIHQAVVRQQAGRRIGTVDTLTRGEVRGGGRKPWRQKGTGRARQGTRRAPQWAGGGVVFGPHPRSYEQKMPAKMRRSALRGALSAKQAEGAVRVVTGFELDAIKTKSMIERPGSLEGGGQGPSRPSRARPDRGALEPQPAGGPRDPGRQPERRRPARGRHRRLHPRGARRAQEVYA